MGRADLGAAQVSMTSRTNEIIRSITSLRARVALFDGTQLSASKFAILEEGEISYDFLLRNGVKAANLLAAGFGPSWLKARGATSAHVLRLLEFDALHLCDADFCNDASLAFGADGVVDAFLSSAADAVSLAGSEAMHILNVSPVQLLQRCAGFPGEAVAVLKQLPVGISLIGVPAVVLLDAGLRVDTLRSAGYGLASIVSQIGPTGGELSKLGFRI